MFAFFVQILIALVLQVIAYLLTPKPKQSQSATRDLEYPSADAGRPIPRVWGKVTVKGVNVLWYGEKKIRKYKVKA